MPAEVSFAGERFNVAADGKRFHCDFIREGPVYFANHGVEVLRRETLERDLETFIGKPLTLEHVETRLNITDPEVIKVTIGLVDKVGRDSQTGWFYAEGEITDDRGREAAKTHNPSCGYRVKSTNAGGRWNNLPYERELSAIEFHHLALSSKRVRYEEAEFRLNAVENPNGESPTMFKFLKKFLAPGAPAGTAPTVQEVEIPADTVIKSASGKEFRLNDVVAGAEEAATAEAAEKKKAADAAAAANHSPAGTEAAAAAVAAAPAAVASAGIAAATQAAEGRINVTDETEVLVAGKPVKVKALIAAHEERLNAAERDRLAGAADFNKLQNASIRGRTDFSNFDKASGGLAEGMKRGKY